MAYPTAYRLRDLAFCFPKNHPAACEKRLLATVLPLTDALGFCCCKNSQKLLPECSTDFFPSAYNDTLWPPPAGCLRDGLRFANGMGTDGTSPFRLMRTALGLCVHTQTVLILPLTECSLL